MSGPFSIAAQVSALTAAAPIPRPKRAPPVRPSLAQQARAAGEARRPAKPRRGWRMQQILDVMQDRQPRKTAEIAQAVGSSEGAAWHSTKLLVKEGVIREHSRYREGTALMVKWVLV